MMMIAIIRNFEKLGFYAFTKVMLKRNYSVKEQTKGRHLQVSVNRGIQICFILAQNVPMCLYSPQTQDPTINYTLTRFK